MELQKLKSLQLLTRILEMSGVTRLPNGSLMSPKGFQLYRGFIWGMLGFHLASCAGYLIIDQREILLNVVPLFSIFQYSFIIITLTWDSKSIHHVIEEFSQVLNQLEDSSENRRELQLAVEKSKTYVKRLAYLVTAGNISYLIGGLKTSPSVSCLGLDLVPCWTMHVIGTSVVVVFAWAFFSLMNVLLYELTAYTKILNVSTTSFAAAFRCSCFIDAMSASVRNCVQCYGVVTNSLIRDGFQESRWYEMSPSARKSLMPLLVMINSPIRLHYKHYTIFDRVLLGQLAGRTHSLMTAMANFL